MILLQLSAGQGPAECALAVAKALRRLHQEAVAMSVKVEEIHAQPGPQPGTLDSVQLVLHGEHSAALAAQWTGTLQWICRSPYRPHHGRKNWFFGGTCTPLPQHDDANFAGLNADIRADIQAAIQADIHIESCRASGPGGQHVNKTASAVRAHHLPSGISVKVDSQRSQHANRRLAVALIYQRLQAAQATARADQRGQQRMAHHQLIRGAACRCFIGEAFRPAPSTR